MTGKMKQIHYFVTDTNTIHTQTLNWVNTNVIIDDENDVARNTLGYDVSIGKDMASNRKCAQVWWLREQANQREELTVMMKTTTTAHGSGNRVNRAYKCTHASYTCRVSKVIAIITISPIEYVTKSSNHFLSRFILFSRINSHTLECMCLFVCGCNKAFASN